MKVRSDIITLSRGCPSGSRRDGDDGLQAEAAVSCLAGNSLNSAKPPDAADTWHIQTAAPSVHEKCSPQRKNLRTTSSRDASAGSSKRLIVGKKRGVKIASLNIHGKTYSDGSSKYKDLTVIMRKNQIAITAIQEARLTPEEAERIGLENPRIQLIVNGDTTSKEGIAFVINKDILRGVTVEHTILIQNRASRLVINWQEDQKIDLINVYYPNEPLAKIEFSKKLLRKMIAQTDLSEPVLLGDFNFVEDVIDRHPFRKDRATICEAFEAISKRYKLVDGWRKCNKDAIQYTFYQESSGSMSRIDRIYATTGNFNLISNWSTLPSAKLSDHDFVYCEVMRDKLPFIGEGPWRMPSDILTYAPFRRAITKRFKALRTDIEKYKRKTGGLSTDDVQEVRKRGNPQTLYLQCKEDIKSITINVAKERKRRLHKSRAALRTDWLSCLRKLRTETDEAKAGTLRVQTQLLRQRLNQIENKNIQLAKDMAKARYVALGERCSKYWFALGKEKRKTEPIMSLADVNGKVVFDTDEMSVIATEYHRDLQRVPDNPQGRDGKIAKMLDSIDTSLNEEQQCFLEEGITMMELIESLKSSKSSKAPGIDGLPYEFWKSFDEVDKKDENAEISTTSLLLDVYQDIENYGVEDEAFTRGIMYLLYKKKDRRHIANYRPLTLLNTDYKIYTKVIAKRLGKVCGSLLNEDQAGFVPGRGLYDHTKLSSLMIEHCDVEGKKGCIVGLDQEKAYDKIAHDYMWQVLKKFGFPTRFINRAQELYKSSRTHIMMNGVLPTPINVERGVRQGDPMSCLLYNLAIEPLANLIRKSKKLRGFKIPGVERPLKITIFADDTCVYFNAKDKLTDLFSIIDDFCVASTARFNRDKTEYMPLGPIQFRQELVETRRIGGRIENTIPEGIAILKDGQAMRTLGAWVGNKININTQWNKILDDQRKVIEVWQQMRPSFKGKELVLKSLVNSRAWFLATVNSMPSDVMDRMYRLMKDFLWDGRKRGLMTWEEVIAPRSEGGLGIPDIKTRLDAIELMWVKKWLAPAAEKPRWAFLIDHFLRRNVAKKPLVAGINAVSWIQQTWHESQARDSKVPDQVSRLLKTARKARVGIHALKVSKKTKVSLVLWHSFAALKNYTWNKKAARCLRRNHGVKQMGDLQRAINMELAPACKNPTRCHAIAITLRDNIQPKYNISKYTPVRDGLDHTPRRLVENMNKDIKETTVTYNPDVTERGDPNTMVRAFMTQTHKIRRREKITHEEPVYRLSSRNMTDPIKVWTDGASKMTSTGRKAGAGIWFGPNHPDNQSLRIDDGINTNQRAELIAIIKALEVEVHRNMIIYSDSLTSLQGLISSIKKWEDLNWFKVANADLVQVAAARMRTRGGTVAFQWVKGHASNVGNNAADALASKALAKPVVDITHLKVESKHKLQGARLSSLTQEAAYAFFLLERKRKPGSRSRYHQPRLDDALDELQRQCGDRPTEEMVWKGLLGDPILPKVSDFLWKTIHEKHKCGPWFLNIPGWTEKAYCVCGEVESIGHIVLECTVRPVHQLWLHAEDTWKQMLSDPKPHQDWKTPSLGSIRGLGALTFSNEGTVSKHLTRRYKILASETAWLIWKKRCQSIFEEREIGPDEYAKSWNEVIRNRIKVDFNSLKMMMNGKQKSKKSKVILDTWAETEHLVSFPMGEMEIHL